MFGGDGSILGGRVVLHKGVIVGCWVPSGIVADGGVHEVGAGIWCNIMIGVTSKSFCMNCPKVVPRQTVTGLSVRFNIRNGMFPSMSGHTKDAAPAGNRWYRSRSFSPGSIRPITLFGAWLTVAGMTALQWASITWVLSHLTGKGLSGQLSLAHYHQKIQPYAYPYL